MTTKKKAQPSEVTIPVVVVKAGAENGLLSLAISRVLAERWHIDSSRSIVVALANGKVKHITAEGLIRSSVAYKELNRLLTTDPIKTLLTTK
jgi:hypothetical protein